MDSGPRVGARGQAFRRNDGLGDGEVGRWLGMGSCLRRNNGGEVVR